MDLYDDDDDDNDDYDDYEAEQRRYGWNRKHAFYNELESLWQDYLEELDYPNTDFIDYVAKNSSYGKDRLGATIIISAWKLIRSFSLKYLN